MLRAQEKLISLASFAVPSAGLVVLNCSVFQFAWKAQVVWGKLQLGLGNGAGEGFALPLSWGKDRVTLV